ncbi:Hsp70 family protein [Verrucomicrobiales bacterium]|jgi:molecular chaperone DnaK (HSP70)|nr:Hsp70 family protein [Verrucomicrobiales bacterium]
MANTFVVGIDLGTSNSAITLLPLETGVPGTVDVVQVTGPNRVEGRSGLSSALYLANSSEFPEGALNLPWQTENPSSVVGEFARNHGSLVTDRLVTSAKSWLSNPHIDPRSAVLPWDTELPAEEKVSAVEASRYYLEHLRQALTHAHPDSSLDDASIVITVPASFQEVARNLTLEAAEAAGFREVILLEEPQAAFYAWLHRVGDSWREQVSPGDLILVCDVGGGTSDFSLIVATETDGQLGLERVSVGEHLLLGGDNMDLALAYVVQGQLAEEGHEIDTWQLWALVHACSQAKVAFFSDPSLTEVPIAVPSRGSSLLAGSLSSTLTRESVESMIIDGFFPLTAIDDLPSDDAAGLQELGLPYASDPVISKHLARFLTRSLATVQVNEELASLAESHGEQGFLRPDVVLFNGGAFKADAVRGRVLELLASWIGEQGVRALEGDEPDLAVAKGASVYGQIRETGEGLRIQAGIPRSYYVGLESSMPSVPGFKPPIKALCVVPQGMEEGTELLIDGQEFGLVIGQPAEFRFFSSDIRGGDEPGGVLPNADRELVENACLQATLPAMEGFAEGERVPVKVNAVVTELGNLQLWMLHEPSGERWKFELEVRGE